MNHTPISLDDIRACPCPDCIVMVAIFDDCEREGRRYYVHDVRMYGRGFGVADVTLLFKRPAAVRNGFTDYRTAVDFCRIELQQQIVDVLLSDFNGVLPLRRKINWRRETFST